MQLPDYAHKYFSDHELGLTNYRMQMLVGQCSVHPKGVVKRNTKGSLIRTIPYNRAGGKFGLAEQTLRFLQKNGVFVDVRPLTRILYGPQ